MKRVLLISYVFPPQPSTGASRAGYISRYLPECGWDVTVLTASPSPPPFDTTVVPVANAAPWVNNLPFRLRDVLLLPDATAAWIRPAIRSGRRLLKAERYDAVLSTAHPPSVHVVASSLARIADLPWVADYRDPWAGNHLRRGRIRTVLEHTWERALVRNSSSITTINTDIAQHLRSFHDRQDVHVIPNAFDPSNWEAVDDNPVARFDLCHAGRIYDGRYQPEILFAALAELRTERDPAGLAAHVHFYGPLSAAVKRHAKNLAVSDMVTQHGMVPRLDAMRAERAAAGLLIFQHMDPSTRNEMGSKYLEYLGAGRYIIAVGPNGGAMKSFLEQRGIGWYATTVNEAKHAVRQLYSRFISGDYRIHADTQGVLTARELARCFAQLLDDAVTSFTSRSRVKERRSA